MMIFLLIGPGGMGSGNESRTSSNHLDQFQPQRDVLLHATSDQHDDE